MRYRKGRGKKKSQVTLSEEEIVEACCQYVKKKGYQTASLTRICIPIDHKKEDSRGRTRRIPLTVEVEIEDQEIKEQIEDKTSSEVEEIHACDCTSDPRLGSTYNSEHHGDY